MNCKPGDSAFIIASDDPYWRKDIGRVVQIVSAWGDGLSWVIEATDARGFLHKDGRVLKRMGEYDSNLRPIRPGDVTDKEVRDLYAPDRSMKDSPPSEAKQPNKKETV